jgi:DNA polymerase-3 subunit alpha
MDLRKANRRAMETLVRSGALDSLDAACNRARLLHDLPRCMQAAEQHQRDQEAGQSDMFGAFEPAAPAGEEPAPSDVPAWPELQRLEAEKTSLGLYLTGHPVKAHHRDLRHFTACPLGEVHERVPQETGPRNGVAMTLAGQVTALRRRTQRGHVIAIEDHTGRLDVFLSHENYANYADVLEKDNIVVVEGNASADSFSGGYRISANHVMLLADAKARYASGVNIAVAGPDEHLADTLEATFAPYRGGRAPVYVHYRNQRARVTLELGQDWHVRPCEELIAALNELEIVKLAGLKY